MSSERFKYKFIYQHATGYAMVHVWKGWVRGRWELLECNGEVKDEKTAKLWAEKVIAEHAKPQRITTVYYNDKGYEEGATGW